MVSIGRNFFMHTTLLIEKSNVHSGIDKFFDNLKQMTNWQPNTIIKSHIVVTITLITPLVISIILYKEVATLFDVNSFLTYGDYHYPLWANWVGWGTALLSIIAIPIGMLHQICWNLSCFNDKEYKSFSKRLSSLVKPTDLWWKNSRDNEQMRNHIISMNVQQKGEFKDNWKEINLSHSIISVQQDESGYQSEANGHVNEALDVTEF